VTLLWWEVDSMDPYTAPEFKAWVAKVASLDENLQIQAKLQDTIFRGVLAEVLCKHGKRWLTQELPCVLDHPNAAIVLAAAAAILAILNGVDPPEIAADVEVEVEGSATGCVNLQRLMSDMLQLLTKEQLLKGPITLFQVDGFAGALQELVDHKGDFGACEKGEWLRKVINGKVKGKPMQSQKAEAAVNSSTRAGAGNAPNTSEESISARTTAIGVYQEDQRQAGAIAAVELAKRRAEQKVKKAEMMALADSDVDAQEATANEDAGVVVGEKKFSAEWRKVSWEKKNEIKRPLSKLGLTVPGRVAQLNRRDQRASLLEDPRYVARVEARMKEIEELGLDRRTQSRRQSGVMVATKKAQAAQRAANPRMKTFDEAALSAVVAASNPAVPLLNFFDVGALLTKGSAKAEKGGNFPKELRAKEIEARRPGYTVPRNDAGPKASSEELLAELVALEIERLESARKVPRDDKGKPTATAATLAAELAVLKGGKALLERLTGFDGEQKEAPLRRAPVARLEADARSGAGAAVGMLEQEPVARPDGGPAAAGAMAGAAPVEAETNAMDEELASAEVASPSHPPSSTPREKRRGAPGHKDTSAPNSPAKKKTAQPHPTQASRQSARSTASQIKAGY
jgi:hypothetical protein